MQDVLHKQDRIISRVKAKFWRTTHKLEIQVPKRVDKAYKIDQQTGTTFSTKSIEKEIAILCVAFGGLRVVTPYQKREVKV